MCVEEGNVCVDVEQGNDVCICVFRAQRTEAAAAAAPPASS